MPGSPPTSVAEAGTSPPPSTRSSSSIPERVRAGGASSEARSASASARPRAPPRPLAPGPAESGASSWMVFQAPQASQRPDHLECIAPQAVQT